MIVHVLWKMFPIYDKDVDVAKKYVQFYEFIHFKMSFMFI
jgi:hypothetical protein